MLRRALVLRFFHRSAFAASVSLLALVALERHAFAFERQWHLGGGLGGVIANGYSLGPAFNAYAAYGISDVFDVRLEAAASRNAPSFLYGAKLALAYKLDVIEWIPYAGVDAGFLGVSSPRDRFKAASPTVGALVGLDYAVSRDFGLGLAGFYDYALAGGGSIISAFLRAEYRFGY